MNEDPGTTRNFRFTRLSWALLAIAIVLPFGIEYGRNTTAPTAPAIQVLPSRENFPLSQLPLKRGRIGAEQPFPGIITNVQIVDFDGNGLPDVVVCDAQNGRVMWYRQTKPGEWSEQILNSDRVFSSPAHATVSDVDNDGDLDVLVAILGDYLPTDERVGKLAWLENDGKFQFRTRILMENVRRVADVQVGDLDGDGDRDLVVAVFGFHHGKIVWLENRGQNEFREHELLAVPGTIHVPLGDFDNDGDLDIVALVSQDEESVLAFENLGKGKFKTKPRKLFASENFDFGTAGLVPHDLDRDGDVDFLLSVGDNLELQTNSPQPWHGCIWLENKGKWNFTPKKLVNFGGAYAAAAGDLDGDGDNDVVVVSMFNEWRRKSAASVVWLENDGQQNFKSWQFPEAPIRLVTVACGDLNGDGRDDIVTGSFQFMPPLERPGRITTWMSSEKAQPGK